MAGLSTMNNNSVHIPVRSISLPSRLHPNSLKIEAGLTRLKSASSLNPLGVETLQTGLTRLAELFICIDELTHSPQTQQSLHHHHLNQVEDVLDGSIGLIDVCSTARDMFLTMQEHIQDLQSALRRRGKDSSIESNVQAYVSFRKRARKDIANSIRTLKRLEKKTVSSPTSYEEHHSSYLIKVMKEVHAIAIGLFQSVMLFLSLPITKTSTGGWPLISKLIRSGFLGSDKDQKIFNEVGRVDIALFSILGQIRKENARFDVQEMQERLKTLAASTQGIEAKLDCVFRCLIQNRVSLLNLVTP
ncbi:uncharacterized protein LOC112535283 [Ricinus communis]|uniref:uncharacterized protein LOC112535283 n=1 Tax=Ricinus communis TaxID=3988 RepID=UPI00201A4787|nr:uncharacterized protein LOC112535283 [Ricinus communis]